MEQIHKRFTAEQVKAPLKVYRQGVLDRAAIEEFLGIGKTRFFVLLRQYRHAPDTFAIGALIQRDASHHRWSPYTKERWVLITSLDDFSRELLYADLFEKEQLGLISKLLKL